MTRGAGSILAGIACTACLVFAPGAVAATLIGDYQFQSTTASSGSGPTLDLVGADPVFQSETVMGVPRQVLLFPQHTGLRMSPGRVGFDFSAVMTFRLDTVGDYRRILDPFNGDFDEGLYAHDGLLDYYDETGTDRSSPSAVLSDGTYATVTLTVSGSPLLVSGYVNGTPVLQHAGGSQPLDSVLRFFKDDGAVEESGGAVSCIRVYSGALTADDVAGIGASATCQAPPQPQPAAAATKKKCKKHKKKHRAAESKKKKCKKKKKH
jgi:hypothetical protein